MNIMNFADGTKDVTEDMAMTSKQKKKQLDIQFRIRVMELPTHLKSDFIARYNVSAIHNGLIIGAFIVLESNSFLFPDLIEVEKKYRRLGVASRLYVYTEKQLGKILTKPEEHSTDAERLWTQPNRPFGNH
jgi:hypothetical protein